MKVWNRKLAWTKLSGFSDMIIFTSINFIACRLLSCLLFDLNLSNYIIYSIYVIFTPKFVFLRRTPARSDMHRHDQRTTGSIHERDSKTYLFWSSETRRGHVASGTHSQTAQKPSITWRRGLRNQRRRLPSPNNLYSPRSMQQRKIQTGAKKGLGYPHSD